MKHKRLGLAMILASGFAGAQGNPPAAPWVRATGEGVVYAKPDQAKLDIGIVSQAATAQAAGAQNAEATAAVLDRLHKTLGPKADIPTISYSLNPNYQFDQGKRTQKGYNAVNTVEVTSDDLSGAGKLIDAATGAGANQVGLQFGIKDEKPLRAQALRKATEEARSNAASMASALGLKLGRVLFLEQGGEEPIRPMIASVAERVNVQAATPVEANTIEVRATVTLTMAVE